MRARGFPAPEPLGLDEQDREVLVFIEGEPTNWPLPEFFKREKAMEEIARIRAKKQVDDALNQRNGPSVTTIHDLPLNSDVLVWREGNTGRSGKWTGPFKMLGIDSETCKVQLPSGPTDFRTTTVKPYLQPEQEGTRRGTDRGTN